MNFAIFQVGEKKYKNINELKGYEKHMERLQFTPNANTCIQNIRLVGTGNIVKDVQKYIEGVKTRSNTVLARDLLLTASPEWMEQATSEIKDKWIKANMEWLNKEFGSNIVYCSAHLDEKTLHLSALLVPVHELPGKGKSLSSKAYFDGAKVMSEWQDKYSEAMKGFELNRGQKWSKASHNTIKNFYTLINKELDITSIESLCAKAKNSELLEIKVKDLQRTLNSYKNYNQKTDQEKDEAKKQNLVLYKEIIDLKHNKEVFGSVIRILSDYYKIPQLHIEKVLNYVVDKVQDKPQEKPKQLERTRSK